MAPVLSQRHIFVASDHKRQWPGPRTAAAGFVRKTWLTTSQSPSMRITDILIEVDDATRFTEAFTHLRTGEPCCDRGEACAPPV